MLVWVDGYVGFTVKGLPTHGKFVYVRVYEIRKMTNLVYNKIPRYAILTVKKRTWQESGWIAKSASLHCSLLASEALQPDLLRAALWQLRRGTTSVMKEQWFWLKRNGKEHIGGNLASSYKHVIQVCNSTHFFHAVTKVKSTVAH